MRRGSASATLSYPMLRRTRSARPRTGAGSRSSWRSEPATSSGSKLVRQMANVQQRAREAVLGSATALREAELMRDSHFDNLRTAYASIARLREALTEAREHISEGNTGRDASQDRRRAPSRAGD